MDLLGTRKEKSHSLESLGFIEEVHLYGQVLENDNPQTIDLILVTTHQLSPKERFEAKKKVRDVFWEISIPFSIKLTTRDHFVSQVSRREGLGRIFDAKTITLFRK